jgi:hypothetical protein
MIVDMRTYTLVPGKLGAFFDMYTRDGFERQTGYLGHPVGFYVVDIGTQNRIVHFWQYEDIGDRQRRRAKMEADSKWMEYRGASAQFFQHMENRICKPTPFFANIKNNTSGPFPCVDMRVYTMHPGKLADYFKLYGAEGLEPQVKNLGACLGYYGSDIGEQNQIVHLWGYKDIEDREKRRAAMFADPAWMKYLGQARPLFAHQTNVILKPAPFWSPK